MKTRVFREATKSDLEDLIRVFKSSIKTAAVKDYSQNEIKEWLKSATNSNRWEALLNEQYVLVVEQDQLIIGFVTLKAPDYLDFIYVHGDYLRQGIAQQLLNAVIDKVKVMKGASLISDVSITAKPFFEKNGFNVVYENQNQRGSEVLINYRMELMLPIV